MLHIGVRKMLMTKVSHGTANEKRLKCYRKKMILINYRVKRVKKHQSLSPN